jgi:hypothetical protein
MEQQIRREETCVNLVTFDVERQKIDGLATNHFQNEVKWEAADRRVDAREPATILGRYYAPHRIRLLEINLQKKRNIFTQLNKQFTQQGLTLGRFSKDCNHVALLRLWM